jgi:trans-aconitate 2-methyltransferase
MNWSASLYTKFEDERSRPVRDLLANIPTARVETAADIGCGPGNSTELLQARFPDAHIVGMDSSPEMIEAARKRLPAIRFAVADIATWQDPGPFDVILGNAVLQWLPDHASLLPRLIGKLAPGGSLALQMPDNLDEPAHQLIRETAADPRWAETVALPAKARLTRQRAEWYYGVLRDAGARVDIWRTTYYHVLAGGPAAVVEWFRGAALRPFLALLDEEEQAAFLARYQAGIEKAYPALADGTVLLPFPRLFMIATR